MRRAAIVTAAVLLLGAGWPTASHDARRTGQSDVRGPRSAARTASVVLTAEQNINMAVTIADDGTVYAGTWGVVRSGGSSDVASWNKFDGKLFALHRSLAPRWTAPLDRVPYCYSFSHCATREIMRAVAAHDRHRSRPLSPGERTRAPGDGRRHAPCLCHVGQWIFAPAAGLRPRREARGRRWKPRDPRVYVVWNDGPARGRAVRH